MKGTNDKHKIEEDNLQRIIDMVDSASSRRNSIHLHVYIVKIRLWVTASSSVQIAI